VTSGILLAATVLLGIVPWRLVAAEPKVSENQKEPPKVALPAYRIEPPDVIQIEMPTVSPLPSYRSTVQPVSGQYLVGPDGTINLRKYGVVVISGKTIADARIAIQNHLKQYLDSPELSVKVVAYNSKVYYIITQDGSSSDKVRRFPATGEERVSDAISYIGGLSLASGKKIWISRPVPHRSGDQQILSVEWDAVTQRVKSATNYQLLPGDRVYVGTPESSPVKTLPTGRDNYGAYGAYQSIPAGPNNGIDEQPVASVKPIPPAIPATGPMILFEDQRLAIIEVWQAKKGQPKTVPYTFRNYFVVGQEIKLSVGNKENCVEITARFLSSNKPNQHVAEFNMVRDPEGKNPVTLIVPKLTLTDDKTESVVITEADGSRIGLNATFPSFDPKTAPETPASSSARPAAEPRAFVNIGVGSDGHEVGVPLAEVRKYAKEHGVSEKEAGKQMLREMAEAEKKRNDDAGQPVPKAEKENVWGDILVSRNGGHIILLKRDKNASSFRCTGGVTIEGKGFTARATELQYDAEKNLLTLSGGKTDCTLYTKGSDGTISRLTAEKIFLSQYSSTVQCEGRSFRSKGVLLKAVDGHSIRPKPEVSDGPSTPSSGIFPDRQSVIDPDRIYDPILSRPTPPRW